MNDFNRKLGYDFNDPDLLELALTHRSYSKKNNERLEFLGDSILNNIISVELYKRFPNISEGDLSRLRASLVKGDTLAEIAPNLSLGDSIYLGAGELKSGGFRRASILADALEAIIGAIFLDSNYEIVYEFVIRLYSEYLENCNPTKELKDPKTRLQELLQSRGEALPIYTIISTSGKSHQRIFSVKCSFEDNKKFYTGQGSSRRKAEQQAAQDALNNA